MKYLIKKDLIMIVLNNEVLNNEVLNNEVLNNEVLNNEVLNREDIEIIAMLFQSVKSLYQIFTIGNQWSAIAIHS